MKHFTNLALSLSLLLPLSASVAQAQEYPNKPIRVIVPLTAGSGAGGQIGTPAADVICRLTVAGKHDGQHTGGTT